MKIARIMFAAALALLAAVPTFAAVPVPPPPKPPADGGADPDRAAWRARGLAICQSEMQPAEGATAAEVQATCGCALDRVAGNGRGDALPAVDPGQVRAQLGSQLLACASDQRPAVTVAIARRLAEPPTADVPTADAKPVDGASPAPTPGEAPKRAGSDGGAFGGLSLPGWVTDSGLPVWAWVLLGFVVFFVLRGLLRGGEQRDLIGPPPHMRLGARANPPAPRRADPPQRS